jgi:Na+-driven multidrug efflux pump
MKKAGASELGLFATVLGVLSIAIPVAGFPFGIFLGSITGIILGILALVFGAKAGRQEKTAWSKAAMVTGIIGIIISILLLLWAVAFLAALAQKLAELQQQGFAQNAGALQ